MVAQVVGQGFADLGRERERVVRAALPPHLQHAGPPVDIIESQAVARWPSVPGGPAGERWRDHGGRWPYPAGGS